MKIFEGTVIATKMQNTAVVKVAWRKPHPLYKKLLKRSKQYKVDTTGQEIAVGDKVRIIETRPISKDKHFRLATADDLKNKQAQGKKEAKK